MVDATAELPNDVAARTEAAAVRRSPPALAADVARYAAFARGRTFSPAQSPAWVEAWTANSGADCTIVMVRDGDAELALPLEIVALGPLRVARFMGSSHANGNLPPFVGASTKISREAIADAVRAARPDVDLVRLERLMDDLAGTANPLAHLTAGPSPNVSLAVDLTGGFDALLERTSGKRKRKKHRSQTRKFEAAGGFRRIEASTPAEVERLLGDFFVLKGIRFREFGLTDVFADEGVRRFFRNLFTDALGQTPRPFVLHALEVAGKLRAITGSSRSADRLICEFGAIADDDLGHASPGDFLFFDNIQDACRDGFAIYDFSVGDEHYKRLWCNIEDRHFDVLAPVSAKGRALAGVLGTASRAKRAIKNNKVLWPLIKRLRRSRASAAIADETD